MRLSQCINLNHDLLPQAGQFLVPLLRKLLEFVAIVVFDLYGLLLMFLHHILLYFNLCPLTNILDVEQLHFGDAVVVVLSVCESIVVQLGSTNKMIK